MLEEILREVEEMVPQAKDGSIATRLVDEGFKEAKEQAVAIIRRRMEDDGWIPCEEGLPEEPRGGWNRCSCAQCIFFTPKLFAGIRELYPEEYAALRQDEIILGFTLDNKCDLDTFVGDAQSCVYHGDARAIHNLVTGEFTPDDVYVKGEWKYPAGAFHGAEGGPC